eukprot:scaffold2.g7127.t1
MAQQHVPNLQLDRLPQAEAAPPPEFELPSLEALVEASSRNSSINLDALDLPTTTANATRLAPPRTQAAPAAYASSGANGLMWW